MAKIKELVEKELIDNYKKYYKIAISYTGNGILRDPKKAKDKELGARALRSIIEELMLDIMYEIPKDKNIATVTVTKEYVEGTGGPVIGN